MALTGAAVGAASPVDASLQRPLGGYQPGALGCARIQIGAAEFRVAGIVVKDAGDLCTLAVPGTHLKSLVDTDDILQVSNLSGDAEVEVVLVHVKANQVKSNVPDSWTDDSSESGNHHRSRPASQISKAPRLSSLNSP